MTRREIAEKAEVTEMTVSNVMNGKKTTNKMLARLIARIKGGKPSDYLYVVKPHARKANHLRKLHG